MFSLISRLLLIVALLFFITTRSFSATDIGIDCAPGFSYSSEAERCVSDCGSDMDAPGAGSDSGLCQLGVTDMFGTVPADLFTWSDATTINTTETTDEKLDVLFFWGVGCPFCESQKPLMAQLAETYPQITLSSFEVYHDSANQALFLETIEKHGISARSIPMTLIGDRHWIGFRDQYFPEMIAEVERQLGLKDATDDSVTPAREIVNIPLVGEVEISTMPLFLATALIAFVDGFNPCSLWLLTVLLGILLHTRSRKKIIIVGLTFLATTAAGYGAFMLGLLNVFMYVGYVDWIKIVVGLMALTFAVVNIKDYFWFKQGVSFTISDKHKPGIFKKMRHIINAEMSTAGMVGATIVMALGITLVELPCTAGFPVIWSNIVALHNLSSMEFALLFAIYLSIYLGIEIAILSVAVITLKRSVFEDKHGRILKLVGGIIMLALAYGIVFQYETLGSISGILSLFGIAALITVVILIVHRVILPRFGIVIGSEKQPRQGGREKE